MNKQIKIKIDPLGNSSVEAVGFNGAGCEAATKGIEDALAGGKGFSRVLKPEWSNPNTEEEQATQGIPNW
jgi:Protein of unknown function (DUF2997)